MYHIQYALLQSIPIAKALWKHVTNDFIVKLPESKGYDAIIVW